MNNIGLIFDMDGVIVNNHQYHFLAWQKLAANHGLTIDEAFYRDKMNGRTMLNIMSTVFGDVVAPENAREIASEKEAIYRKLYADELKPTDGLLNFLQTAKEAGVPMAIGTSAPEENVSFTLDGLSIRDYFGAIIDERHVTKGKPDPEVYVKCAAGIGRPNNRCIVFEDAISGIQAGKNAGSKVIGLATSHKRDELNADYIMDDFSSFSLDLVQQIIEN